MSAVSLLCFTSSCTIRIFIIYAGLLSSILQPVLPVSTPFIEVLLPHSNYHTSVYQEALVITPAHFGSRQKFVPNYFELPVELPC